MLVRFAGAAGEGRGYEGGLGRVGVVDEGGGWGGRVGRVGGFGEGRGRVGGGGVVGKGGVVGRGGGGLSTERNGWFDALRGRRCDFGTGVNTTLFLLRDDRFSVVHSLSLRLCIRLGDWRAAMPPSGAARRSRSSSELLAPPPAGAAWACRRGGAGRRCRSR